MKNVFVFPCGSEIALEIARSLKHNPYFHLIGGHSVPDHGRFVFDDRESDLPWESSPDFISRIKEIVTRRKIDIIYPAMDSSIVRLKSVESELGCKVICAPLETTNICLSKQKTYDLLKGVVRVPQTYTVDTAENFPVFCKPDVGYGARGTARINSADELRSFMQTHHDALICEYLSGEEFTVDCFTDRHGVLRFCGPRVRSRIANGISVNTYPVSEQLKKEFCTIAEKINKKLTFRGAWFFQMKKNAADELVLLEIAARFGGSSALYRARGVNFAELSLWDALDCEVSILENDYFLEMDRALDNCFKLQLNYNEVFIACDETVILEDRYYNPDALKFICQCKNKGIKVTLLSRHKGDLGADLTRFALDKFFDRVIHVPQSAKKSEYIDNPCAVFIDDSLAERLDVGTECRIPVFGVDAINILIDA